MRRIGLVPLGQQAFVMPTVIVLMSIMTIVAYAALIQSNNSLNLAYKQAYIQMARVGSKAAIDYAQEQFDNATCGNYSGTAEQDLISTNRYRLTFKAEVISTSADGYEKTIKGTGSVYLPKLSATAQYVFDIRSEIVRTYAVCKTPDNFAPLVWLDASDTSTLFTGSTSTSSSTITSNFGNVSDTTRSSVEERADNGTQTTNSWQSSDLEMHTCDNAEFSSSICSNNSSRYLYSGLVFENVNIAQNATITAATLYFDCASGGSSGPLSHRVYGIYKSTTNPHYDLFTSTGSNQVRTAITTNGRHTTNYVDNSTNNCPPGNGNNLNVTGVVQEIVNHSGWNPATDSGRMAFGVYRTSGNGARKFSKNNMRLTVTYSSTSVTASTSNNDTIVEWHDRSGNGNHAKTAYGNSPIRVDNQINSKTVVRFNNGTLLSALTSALSGKREMTVFAIIKPNFSTSSSDGRIVSGMSSAANNDTSGSTAIIPLLRNGSTSGISSLYSGNSNTYRTNFACSTACDGNAYLMVSLFDINDSDSIDATLKGNGSQGAQKTNLSPAGSPYTYGIDQLYIGGRRNNTAGTDYLNGDFAEIVVYDKALECRQIEALEDYFRSKWGLSATQYVGACPADLVPTL